ncbi:GIY-YIG nuclease family protein [Arthrobacter sp. B2a2-09]|uniref:GIY-YIG nuclease family protein n=1 Tax=Arthrobacter sp. B2a2-09 TaxID=2952822 RepID=UPI0022CDB5BE|nr:GIY-YIG nuclease family protein [Arthrobacter sp. B2a2-09]MCZ9881701.1 GIY-YIG nuclease family protein [Arthrobacter sp. B2a2-09]
MADLHSLVLDVSGESALATSVPLTLGHLLASMGADHVEPIQLKDILVVRHAFKPGDPVHLHGPEVLTVERVLEYTRVQWPGQFAKKPPRYWVILVADGGRRSRLFGVLENYGEVQRTDAEIHFDLRPSSFLSPLVGRLVVEWGVNTQAWYWYGETAAKLPVLEIADRDKVPFPGFDNVLLTYHELCEMVGDSRYVDWQVALSEVQGIYLITDSTNGRQYVGKAEGAQRILGRWTAYAQDGHGGNVALRQLAYDSAVGEATRIKKDHARHFVFSLLRVFGPSTPSSEVDLAESHYKDALMTRKFGLNRN